LATTISLQTKTKKSIQLQFQKTKKLEISKSTDKTVYFWEVSTTTGSASGYAMSEAQALKTIKLMGTNDLLPIESLNLQIVFKTKYRLHCLFFLNSLQILLQKNETNFTFFYIYLASLFQFSMLLTSANSSTIF
jgi:hypothetical protein